MSNEIFRPNLVLMIKVELLYNFLAWDLGYRQYGLNE